MIIATINNMLDYDEVMSVIEDAIECNDQTGSPVLIQGDLGDYAYVSQNGCLTFL